jgi:pilus assembly protein CpaE
MSNLCDGTRRRRSSRYLSAMARLIAAVLSDDDTLRKQMTRMLRDGRTPVSVADERGIAAAGSADLVIVDGRHDLANAIAAVERSRAAAPAASIFLVAQDASSDLILQSMRAGANEFLTWPLVDQAFEDAVARASSRRGAAGGAAPLASVVVFIGAKGGVGTTTLAVNSGVELAGHKKPTIVVDLKQGLGDVALFLGVRSRYSILDAIDNAERLDREFLAGLVARHVSGLELLPGSDQFDRPASTDGDTIDHILRLLSVRYEYMVVDAGAQLTPSSMAALYMSEVIGIVINPDVPSIRNGQRLIEHIGQMGACSERVKVLLNRAAAPYPIPLSQIEEALGQKVHLTFPSDYRTVATALNSGVPLTFGDNSDMAEQFKRLTRLILNPTAPQSAPNRRLSLGLPRFASLW